MPGAAAKKTPSGRAGASAGKKKVTPPAKAKKAMGAKKPSGAKATAARGAAVRRGAGAAKTATKGGAAKTTAKKTAVKKIAVKKPLTKKTAVRKPVTKKTAVKKAPPAKQAVKKAAPAKKAVTKAAPPKKAGRTGVATKAPPAKASGTRKKTVICELSGFEVTPSPPNLSPKTLERLRQKLLDEKHRLLHQADELAAEADQLAREREAGDTQFDEESGEGDTVNIERERDLLLSASARQVVEEIDDAIVRIKKGTYGVCRYAGRRISLERLEAIPWADVCVDCKARAERRR